MPSVYLNLTPENHAYLKAQATAARTTQTHVADAIISEARRLGWHVEHTEAARIVQPRDPLSGAASGAAAGHVAPHRADSRGPARNE
jgi:hypothetical protein